MDEIARGKRIANGTEGKRDDAGLLAIINEVLQLEEPMLYVREKACNAAISAHAHSQGIDESLASVNACGFLAALCRLRLRGYCFALLDPKEPKQ